METKNIENSAKVVIDIPFKYIDDTHRDLLNEFDEDLVNAVMEYHSNDTDEAHEALNDLYLGEYDDFLDWVTESTKQIWFTDQIPKIFKDYFNFKQQEYDLNCEGMYYDLIVNCRCHVFEAPRS